ncbi:MAG: hypothetical protein RL563_1093 [Pseudomonadota bacterium]|jgi:hypothetical protein
MNDDQLKALLDTEIKNSLGYSTGQLARDREKALYYYYGQAKGDLAPSSIEGRSSVVDTSVMDTVEWMLPTILRMFTAGDKVVEFQAKREQFEEQAKHATEYIGHHVFKVQNPGFSILHTWFKDAMLSKVGIVKVWWDVTQDESREDYKGLTDIELGMLLQDKHVQPIEHSEYIDQMTGEMCHDIAVKRVVDKGFCRIENVPPEEFLISRRAKNCEDAPFAAHRFERTIGQLKEAGYKNVDNLSSDDSDGTLAPERITRKLQNDELGWLRDTSQTNDPSMRSVWVTECFLKVDYDGDGIPEWRKITRVGNTILANEECDGNPFVTITPVPIPHQFFGLSVADLAMEAQRTKTGLMRAMIDNIYLSVNGRTWAVENQVNLNDLLTNRPGGVVRVKSPDAVGALSAGAGNLRDALGMMDYIDQAKENRTGFTRYSQGGNADALNQTATGISIITNKADMRLELIARNFAENGVRPLFSKILELISKYQDKVDRIKATGGWVDIDPREWKNQFTLAVNVGLGTGNKDEILQSLQTLAIAMGQAAQAGIVKPDNIYAAAVKLTETLGFPNPSQFFTDPSTLPPPEPQPDPALLQVQAAIEINKQQMELEEKKTMAKISQDQLKLEAEIMMKREELAAKIGIQQEEFNNKIITQQVLNGFAGTGA